MRSVGMRAGFELRATILAASCAALLALSGCAGVDKALFGSNPQNGVEPSTTPAPEASDNDADQGDAGTAGAQAPASASGMGAAGSTEAAGPMPGTLPPVAGAPAAAPPPAVVAASPAPSPAPSEPVNSAPLAPAPITAAPATAAVSRPALAPVSGAPAISPVVIAPGPDTGTPVNHAIAGLRAGLQEIAARLSAAAQQYASLRSSSAQQVAAYYQAQAQISARLQIGTTRGNPELVAQWNAAQAALDQLTANVNALGGLDAQASTDSARTRGLLGQIQSTLSMPGATDEDHRQLAVLEDEANQTIVVLERLSRDMTADVRRQGSTLNTERPRLAQLANAIKAGDLYASSPLSGATPTSPAVSVGNGAVGQPIVTIRFARRNTNYQRALYNALNQALQGQPTASFRVVGVSPTRGSAAAVQAAQNDARRRAQEVMRTMGEMGVPATRMEIVAETDPSISGSEVLVFIR